MIECEMVHGGREMWRENWCLQACNVRVEHLLDVP